MTCPLCGSEEVYRNLDKRRRFGIWAFVFCLGFALPPLFVFAIIAFVVIPFTGETVCRNCGLILSSPAWQAASSPSPPTAI